MNLHRMKDSSKFHYLECVVFYKFLYSVRYKEETLLVIIPYVTYYIKVKRYECFCICIPGCSYLNIISMHRCSCKCKVYAWMFLGIGKNQT